jgi:hypothetical protein
MINIFVSNPGNRGVQETFSFRFLVTGVSKKLFSVSNPGNRGVHEFFVSNSGNRGVQKTFSNPGNRGVQETRGLSPDGSL